MGAGGPSLQRCAAQRPRWPGRAAGCFVSDTFFSSSIFSSCSLRNWPSLPWIGPCRPGYPCPASPPSPAPSLALAAYPPRLPLSLLLPFLWSSASSSCSMTGTSLPSLLLTSYSHSRPCLLAPLSWPWSGPSSARIQKPINATYGS